MAPPGEWASKPSASEQYMGRWKATTDHGVSVRSTAPSVAEAKACCTEPDA